MVSQSDSRDSCWSHDRIIQSWKTTKLINENFPVEMLNDNTFIHLQVMIQSSGIQVDRPILQIK